MGRGKDKRKKLPEGYGADVVSSKTPRVSRQFDTGEKDTPVWLVGDMEIEGPFGWQVIEKDCFIGDVFPKLKNFETMTWGEILRSGSHEVRVADLCSTAQKRRQERRLDDVEHLVSLRLTGVKRVWGIRRQRALRLLWWDPEHQVYPSHKKHT